ncbi:MAG: hypothetical protein AAFN93_15415, partial [Bacteroidota bacterium]
KDAGKKLSTVVKLVVYKETDTSFYALDQASLLVEHKVYSVASRPVLYILDHKNKRGRLLLNGNTNSQVSKEERVNIERQLINKVIESGGMDEAIRLSTDEVQRIKRRKLQELIAQNKDDNTDEAKRKSFWAVIWFLVIVSVCYILLYLHKSTRKTGKEYENMEFYSLSGFSKSERLASYAVVFLLLMVIYYLTVFYYHDIIILGILSIVAIVPTSNLLLFVGKVSMAAAVRGDVSSKPPKLSLLERKLLIKPEITGFDLIKINFAQLLLSKKIAVEIEYRDMPDGRSRVYYIIMKGEHFPTTSILKKDLPFLDSLEELDTEAGYYLHDYAKQVNNRINGLKAYKRNFVGKGLVEKGLLSKWSWALNVFKTTSSGMTIGRDINAKRGNLRNQLVNFKADGLTKIPLNIDYLLFENFGDTLHQIAETNNDEELATWADAVSIFDDILDREKWDETKVVVDSEY